MTLVSIVMTVYNRQQYLARAIQSVLDSDYNNFELIIWDDGSTDKGVEIATKFAKQDSRIKFTAAKHQGHSLALRDAIKQTQGQHIGCVDSDDILHPSAIAITTAHLNKKPNVGMVYTDCWRIDENENVLGLDRRSSIPYSPQRLLIDFMTFHFRLFKRDVFKAAGGINPAFDTAPDYDLCLRLSEMTEIERIKKPLYFYRVHQDNMSNSLSLTQVCHSQQAVEQALVRRGLADSFELKVRVKPQFYLQSKTVESPVKIGTGHLKRDSTSKSQIDKYDE